MKEELLIAGCIANDISCQKELYKRFAGKMLVICMRYSNDRPEAEDILQEGFSKVFENIKKFRKEGSFEGWIKRIMINTALKNYRKKKKLHPVVELNEALSKTDTGNLLSQLAFEELIAMIQKLPERYQIVFNLYVIEEFSHKEICDLTGIPEGTSKSHLARARKMLQKMIIENEKIENDKFIK